MLQGRFQILRHEFHEESDEMIILISQICVILHNMVVDMWQKGGLGSETSEDGESVEVVVEFLEDYGMAAAVAEGNVQEK